MVRGINGQTGGLVANHVRTALGASSGMKRRDASSGAAGSVIGWAEREDQRGGDSSNRSRPLSQSEPPRRSFTWAREDHLQDPFSSWKAASSTGQGPETHMATPFSCTRRRQLPTVGNCVVGDGTCRLCRASKTRHWPSRDREEQYSGFAYIMAQRTAVGFASGSPVLRPTWTTTRFFLQRCSGRRR